MTFSAAALNAEYPVSCDDECSEALAQKQPRVGVLSHLYVHDGNATSKLMGVPDSACTCCWLAGTTLNFGQMIGKLKRDKLMKDVMQSSETRSRWVKVGVISSVSITYDVLLL
jgi:hypothetical protein